MADKELFRTTLVGGYDKDDVEKHIQKMKDEAYVNKNRLIQVLKQREQTIQELTGKLNEKELQLRQKERDIKEKYQTYIDNYEQIGRLVYESRVRADRMIIEAREESRRIIEEARTLARRRLDQVQEQIDDKLDEGRLKHQAIQKELEDMLELLKQVRNRCLLSYENVEKLIENYTDHEDPFADIMTELEEKTGVSEFTLFQESTLQEQIDFMRNSLSDSQEPEDEMFDEEDSLEAMEHLSGLLHEIPDEEPEEFPEIQILSVEEVLKAIDQQQTACAAAKASEENTRQSGETDLEEYSLYEKAESETEDPEETGVTAEKDPEETAMTAEKAPEETGVTEEKAPEENPVTVEIPAQETAMPEMTEASEQDPVSE
ncbi:MAG: hypothetical protein Q4B85_02340 [Lachnospiraceae bacterium]|nr:hypothetical protein [Lachnospiraceae bacterium]